MQYSRALCVVILAVAACSYGQQPPASQSRPRLGIECDHAIPPAGMHWVCKDRNNPCNCQLESDRGGGMLDGDGEQPLAGRVARAGFEQMMNALASAKAQGNTAEIEKLLAEDAIGSNLTTGQVIRGRAGAAAQFLAGGKNSRAAAALRWHHLFFDEREQMGFGEFTLEGSPRYHGVVILKLENGKIAHWREYRIASSRSWEKLTAENPF